MSVQTLKIRRMVDAIKTWSPPEQLELIQAITKLLEDAYESDKTSQIRDTENLIPSADLLWRSSPIVDLGSLVADFWPQNESADEINEFVYQQRQEDLQNEL